MMGWTGLLLVPGIVAFVTASAGWCRNRGVAAVQLLLPWWGGLAVAVAATGLVARTWWLVLAALATGVGIGVVIGPKVQRGRRPTIATDSRSVVSVGLANIYLDNPEPDAMAAQLLDEAPDILVLTELTPALLVAFDAAGGRARYPHRVHREPLQGEYEAGIFSQGPFVATLIHTVDRLRVVEATVARPGRALRVVAVHPDAPTSRAGFRTWRAQLATLRDLLASAAPTTVAVGDLNAGAVQSPYEALLTTGFRDAHDVVGRGLAPSWGKVPSFPRWLPTLGARLDHVLVGPAVEVLAVRDLDAIGSDHRPCVADLVLGE
jgi:endonuclease/exonuclease/phosphatase family metal-dependent hydrolase